jgi:glycosyltransferase involved in cell wall biosynthesis
LRVLYSFPGKIGAGRIDFTAWQQVSGLVEAGATLTAFPGAVYRPLPSEATVRPTLARGKWRIPYKALGRLRAFELHDRIVSRRLVALRDEVDIVHTWPLGARHTLRMAQSLGLPTVLERPNAYTRFAYEVVQREAERIGVPLPPGHEHTYDPGVLAREEEEYALAFRLLCPSDFVVRTFADAGFAPDKLVRHMYGYDDALYTPAGDERTTGAGLTALFVGISAVRKGTHFAVEAWLDSSACRSGRLSIVGDFIPAYREKLAPLLAHPSIEVLGHRSDVPELMRNADILILPTIEEGSPLVCSEALGSGCVPVVSDVCDGVCRHLDNALVHQVGDVRTLTEHLTMLDTQRDLLERLRTRGLQTAKELTWSRAGEVLMDAYAQVIDEYALARRGAAGGA